MTRLRTACIGISADVIGKGMTAVTIVLATSIVVASVGMLGVPTRILPLLTCFLTALAAMLTLLRVGSRIERRKVSSIAQAPVEGHLITAARELTDAMRPVADEELTTALARIVKLHAGMAVGSAFIPVPGADMMASAANVWTMYVRINKALGMTFSENVLKSFAAGVVSNLAAGATSLLVVGSALKFVPGLGSLGGAALMATTVNAMTTASGIIYMRAITEVLKTKTAKDTRTEDLKAAADQILQDKDMIHAILAAAKRDYRQSHTLRNA